MSRNCKILSPRCRGTSAAPTVKRAIQVIPLLPSYRTWHRKLTVTDRMGELECKSQPLFSRRQWPALVLGTKHFNCVRLRKQRLTWPGKQIVGYIPLHALCRLTPEIGDTHLEGQISQYGHVVNRSSAGMFPDTSHSSLGVGLLKAEHATEWQYICQQGLQSQEHQAWDPIGCRRGRLGDGKVHEAKIPGTEPGRWQAATSEPR